MNLEIAKKIGFVFQNEPNFKGYLGPVSWKTGFVLASFWGAGQDATKAKLPALL
jgi:hypothetical protein